MITLFGKNEKILSAEELCNIISGYEKVCVDIGTGDGKNIYRKAKQYPNIFFIGIDPVKSGMTEIACKIIKKPEKGGLNNALLVISTAENMPKELYKIADIITILFPWGILLEGIIKPLDEFLDSIKKVAKHGTEFEFITTYSKSCEDNVIKNRNLPELSLDYFNGTYKDILAEHGFMVSKIELHNNEYVKKFDSKWAKQLAFGRNRDFYRITGEII